MCLHIQNKSWTLSSLLHPTLLHIIIIRKQDVHHHTPRRPEAGNSFTINDEQASSLRVEDTLDSDVQSKLIVEQTSPLRVKDTLDCDAQSKLIVEQTSPLRVKDTLDSDAQSKLIVEQTSPLRVKDTLDSDAQSKLIVEQTSPLRVKDTLDSDAQSKLIVVKQTSPLDSDAQSTKLIVDQTNPLRVEDTLDSDTQSKLIVKQTRAKWSARRKRVRPPTDPLVQAANKLQGCLTITALEDDHQPKSKRKRTKIDESRCHVCKEPFIDGQEAKWVGCDFCPRWFHKKCIKGYVLKRKWKCSFKH